ncbi:MAG: COX15/CtaA family protein [Blastomonas fulva]|uniref:COX15/CtaA family protein n=1 Tax=Blastomonas fulva TaxID=1550728 RepID=UPI0024E22A83|nr:COX15/CtaA family protein [Blastomonas fulva]MDK2756299.1 COX15/CtaA family protein [Blastomonas fulva]
MTSLPHAQVSPVAPARRAAPSAIANWLYGVAMLVFVMVVVGGITRLTESGLSITEWNVVTGTLPPLSEAAWVAEFEKYKQIPEYTEINVGMTLAEFKTIFFWEYVHRLLGRLVGVAFALPFLYFAVRRAIPQGYGWRLTALFALGGLQGAVGWWMVASGLSERTDVSHFRLAVHLLNALFIMAGLIWTALDLKALARDPAARPARMTGLSLIVIGVLFLQLLFGAWVAGLNAGYAAKSWPLMNGAFFPVDVDWSQGLVHALTHDPFLLHFIHRWWAFVAVAALVVMGRAVRRVDRRISLAIHTAFGLQILLGIATVMTSVDLHLAVLHQAVGAILVATTAWGAHRLGQRDALQRQAVVAA